MRGGGLYAGFYGTILFFVSRCPFIASLFPVCMELSNASYFSVSYISPLCFLMPVVNVLVMSPCQEFQASIAIFGDRHYRHTQRGLCYFESNLVICSADL